jgi:hypothetical protein
MHGTGVKKIYLIICVYVFCGMFFLIICFLSINY